MRLWLQVVFPHETDPRSDDPLSTYIGGDAYDQPGRWQLVRCQTGEKPVQARIRELRAALNRPDLNIQDAFVNRAILTGRLPAGATEVLIDELRFGPIVEPEPNDAVLQASGEQSEPAAGPRVDVQLGRLVVDGKPYFPIIAARHGESAEMLRTLGVNVVWIPNYEDAETLAELRQNGLWVMATPPRAVTAAGEVIAARDVSLAPLGEETAPVLLWNLGTRVPPERQDDLFNWIEQVRNADRLYKRPLAVDVVGGDERLLSRRVPLLGLSRHVANTSLDYKQLREWLLQKRKLARPGSFVWTWVQTEPAPIHAQSRRTTGEQPVVIEPEQLRLQVYTALAAGCRGIGYWKGTGFDADLPGTLERRLALTQINMELSLLAPFLATAKVDSNMQVPFQIEGPTAQPISRSTIDFRNTPGGVWERDALLRERQYALDRAASQSRELEATIIRSDYGTLLLPIWYGSDAQFVPGQMAAMKATVVVPPVSETDAAFLVSTTSVHALPHKRVAGGMRIELSKFDQTAAVVITSDRMLIDVLRQKAETLAQSSAETMLALARAKYERVVAVDQDLQSLGAGQPDGPQITARSRQSLAEAEEALGRGQYKLASEHAGDSMQALRILQRAYWNDAVRSLSSPLSSPHTLCFQTLPDHWRLMRRVAAEGDSGTNLLRSGDFEDFDTVVAEGWRHEQNEVPGVQAGAELYPSARQGHYAMRLAAVPLVGQTPPAVMPASPVTVTTPPMEVRSGQVLHVSGWVRVPRPITGSLDGAVLYDSIAGSAAALRWTGEAGGEWRRFLFLREVPQAGSYTLTLELAGLGEVHFDDVRVVAFDPQTELAEPTPTAPGENPLAYPLRLLDRLPRLNANPFRR
jgi:hypothetical protein